MFLFSIIAVIFCAIFIDLMLIRSKQTKEWEETMRQFQSSKHPSNGPPLGMATVHPIESAKKKKGLK